MNGLDRGATFDAPPADQPNATRLVSGILDDATTLIRQNIAMLRAEVREDLRKTTEAAKYMGLGSALAALGGLFLVISLVPLLGWLAPSLPPWACWAIVGGVLLVIGGITFVIGRSLLRSFSPLPDKSLNALQENVSWITKPRS